MKKVITYTRRFKTGEYEFEEFTQSATVENSESEEMLKAMKEEVLAAAGVSPEVPEQEEEEAPVKNGKKKSKPVEEEEPEEDNDDESESDEEPEDSDDEESDEDSEEEEEKPSKKKSKDESEKSPGKKFKKKPQNYSRSSEQHKSLFSNVLREVAPDWKKSEKSKKAGKIASQKMEGKEFLDETGEVVDSFKAEVKKLMKAKK